MIALEAVGHISAPDRRPTFRHDYVVGLRIQKAQIEADGRRRSNFTQEPTGGASIPKLQSHQLPRHKRSHQTRPMDLPL